MLTHKHKLFRKKPLERLSSPERLDQLMQLVTPKSWLPLAFSGALVVVASVWSVYGRIPITVEGRGVLIYPSKVVSLQSKSSGQLLALNIKAGDVVKKGDVLATLDQTELRKQLQLQQAKLSELISQDRAVSLLQGQGSTQELKTIQQQRLNAQQRIQELQALTPVLKQKSRESIQKQRLQLQQHIVELQNLAPVLKQKSRESLAEQRQSLQTRIQIAQAQLPVLKKRVDSRRPLLEQRVISDDVFLQAEREYLQKVEDVAQLATQMKELEVKEGDTDEKYINNINEIARNRAELQKLQVEETNAEEAYLNNINEISKLQADLKDLDTREPNLAKQNLQDLTVRKNQIQEVEREIAKLELQLSNDGQIVSQHSGRILEVTVTLGQVIGAGTRLGSVGEENLSDKLVGITYFPISEGKKIQLGMPLQITPQTIKRERFGGIAGKVSNISPFPITKEGANSVVGNPQMVEGLVSQKQDGVIEVFANLETDSKTFSGYKWSSSQGPQLNISPGTTTIVRVTVEERAPITYIFPFLRSASGIY